MDVAGYHLVLDTGDIPLTDLFAALAGAVSMERVGIGRTFGDHSYEEMDPEVSGSLFPAMRQNRMAGHPVR